MRFREVYAMGGKRYYLDDREVTEEEFRGALPPAKEIGVPLGGQPYVTPILSDAMAVHPSQIEASMERDRKAGVPTEYTQDGRPIITSHHHQKALAKSLGLHNRNAFL